MSKKFKYEIAINGTKEEIDAIIPNLEQLGYRYDSHDTIGYKSKNTPRTYPILITHETGEFMWYDNSLGRTQIPATNPDLVLALAAMIDSDEFHVGEYIIRHRGNEMWASLLNGNCPNGIVPDGSLLKISRIGERDGSYIPLEVEYSGKFYGMSSEYVDKATDKEIIKHFEDMNQQILKGLNVIGSGPKSPTSDYGRGAKKIIGYKFKSGFEKYSSAACMASNLDSGDKDKLIKFLSDLKEYSDTKRRLEAAGLLDLWFEPVYEKQKTTIDIECIGGSFQVEIRDGGIYYDGTSIPVMQLEKINSDSYKVFEWNVNVNTIDIGCKKGIRVSDIKDLLHRYNEIYPF